MGQGFTCLSLAVFANWGKWIIYFVFIETLSGFSRLVGGSFQKRRRRIDRSMIGEPTNFVHTTHVGSGDMGMGLPSVRSFLSLLLLCMKSPNGSTSQSFLANRAEQIPVSSGFAVEMKLNHQLG